MRLSLRLRLIILPALVVLASLLLLGVLEIRDARTRVATETEAGLQMGRLLVRGALNAVADEPDASAALARLRQNLPPTLRHVSIAVAAPGEQVTAAGQGARAPLWFSRLVAASVDEEHFAVVVDGRLAGGVLLAATPEDEIAEVWTDWRSEMAMLAIVSAAIILVVLVALNLALHPIARLTEALDRLEGGDFSARVKGSSDPQLRRLTQRFNSLAASLEQVSADNRRLIDRLMTIQEDERKEIAAELHDEIGPTLFAIRADIGAISRWTRSPGDIETVRERLGAISGMITQIQRINSRLLAKLRPVVLDQMPLAQAILTLLESWRERHPEISWSAKVDQGPELAEERRLAIYLAAQEALTNVVRHAEAARVDLRLDRGAGQAVLTVSDDGKGIPGEGVSGFGLLGMAERAKALGGGLTLEPRVEGGTLLVFRIPEDLA